MGVLDGPGLDVLVLQDEGVEGGRVCARPLDERRRIQQLKQGGRLFQGSWGYDCDMNIPVCIVVLLCDPFVKYVLN